MLGGMTVSVNVRFHQVYEPDWFKEVTLTGSPDDSLAATLLAAVGHTENDKYTIDLPWIEDLRWNELILDESVTLGQVSNEFGDEQLLVHNAGAGGGGQPVATLGDAFAEISRALKAARALAAVGAIIRYRHQRKAVKDWLDSDFISTTLREFVMNEPDWPRSEYDSVFALDAGWGPKLLRELGYERRGEGTDEHWVRDLEVEQ